MDIPTPQTGRFIGHCIYCGEQEEELSREHAVPFGLNGPWTIGQASCQLCSQKTTRFERGVLKDLLPLVRIVLRMQSRRKKSRPKKWPLVIRRGETESEILVDIEDYPLYLPSPILGLPGSGFPPLDGSVDTSQLLEFRHLGGPSFEDACVRYQANFVGSRTLYNPEDFKRTLAKIGYCVAVFSLGFEPFIGSPIPGMIVDKESSCDPFVGAWEGEPVNDGSSGGLHEVQVKESNGNLHAFVRLFAQFGAPEYHVHLGPASPESTASAEWPFQD